MTKHRTAGITSMVPLQKLLIGLGIALAGLLGVAAVAEAAAPTVTGASPSAAVNNGSVNVAITGSGFGSATSAALKRSGQPDIVGTSLTVHSSTSADAVFNLAGAAPGPWDLVVTNTDGSGTCSGCFTVAASGPPSVTAVSPDEIGQSASGANVALAGSHFARGDTVEFSGSGITVHSTTFVSSTRLNASISVDPGATVGARSATVVHTSGYGSGSCTGCLTINQGPTVAAPSPNNAGQGASGLQIAITGSNFVDTPTVSFSGSGITVSDVRRNSSTSLAVVVDVAPSTATGSRDVIVTNPDRGSASCSGCFTVNTGPVMGSVSPTSAGQGAPKVTMTVNGPAGLLGDGNFEPGSKVTFSGAGITVSSTAFNANTPPVVPSTLSVEFAVASDAEPGKRDVIVTNPDQGRSVCSECFTVNAGPQISAISPSGVGQNATGVEVKVTGENFAETPTVSVDGGGVTVNGVTRDSATQLTVNLSVASTAATGNRTVTITNPDQGEETCAACLTINAKPGVTTAAPSRIAQGATARQLVISGADFVATPTVSISGAGVTVDKVVRDSASQLTATLTVANSAAADSRDITVTNPDKGSATCTGCLAVTVGPSVTKATPNVGANTGSFTVKIDGSNFASGATVALRRDEFDDIPATNVIVDSSSSLWATFDLHAAPPGAWEVSVTNVDYGSATCASCFSIAGSKPLVSSASPAARSQGVVRQDVLITGQNFARGASVLFSGSGIVIHSTSLVDTANLRVNISVSTSAATGARDIEVVNTDGQSGECADCFAVQRRATVTLSAPTTLSGPVVATFSSVVRDVNSGNFRLQVNDGSGQQVPVKAMTCSDATGASTSCGGSSVRVAKLTPRDALMAGQHYRTTINPSGATPVTDSGGAWVSKSSKWFRAARVEQENGPGSKVDWGRVWSSSAYGRSYVREHSSWATATFSFTGTSVTWYTVTGRDQGAAKVYIDGVLRKTVDNYSWSRRYKVARSFTGLSQQPHTLRIVATGKKSSASATNTYVSVDALRVGSGSVQTSPRLAHTWKSISNSAASGGRYARSDVKGASTSLTFHGTGVDWYTVYGRYNGIAKVYIDGKYARTVDGYRSSTSVGKISFRNLRHSVHTIKVVVTGAKASPSRGRWVAVDRWVVQ